ncbi:MAG: zinc ribbon domain-containing protein [Clostridia bacterium]|nr:zinc ribbon domain-containing protein [Clostridia bacterium]
MALIICKNCGKKISDTAEVCIHCGISVNEEVSVEIKRDETSKNGQSTQAKTRQFEDLNDEVRTKLEREFLKSNNWASKYKKNELQLPAIGRLWILYLGFAFIYLEILSLFDIYVAGPIINEKYFDFGLLAVLALMAITLCLFVYSIGMRIYLKSTSAKYIYLRKFQAWLKKEKNVDFIPTFKRKSQLAKFESVQI